MININMKYLSCHDTVEISFYGNEEKGDLEIEYHQLIAPMSLSFLICKFKILILALSPSQQRNKVKIIKSYIQFKISI